MPRWDSNPQSQRVSGLRPRGRWDRQWFYIVLHKSCKSYGIPYNDLNLYSIELYFYDFCKDGLMMVS